MAQMGRHTEPLFPDESMTLALARAVCERFPVGARFVNRFAKRAGGKRQGPYRTIVFRRRGERRVRRVVSAETEARIREAWAMMRAEFARLEGILAATPAGRELATLRATCTAPHREGRPSRPPKRETEDVTILGRVA